MQKKLKDLFDTVARVFQPAEKKTFVRFWIDGAEAQIREVADRDVKKLDIPADTQGFTFFDRDVKPGQALNKSKLVSKAYNTSPMHFFAERILTPREFHHMAEEERSKLHCFVNQDTHEDSRIAIDGATARFVNTRFGNGEVIVDRETREQLWPPRRPPLFPSEPPKP